PRRGSRPSGAVDQACRAPDETPPDHLYVPFDERDHGYALRRTPLVDRPLRGRVSEPASGMGALDVLAALVGGAHGRYRGRRRSGRLRRHGGRSAAAQPPLARVEMTMAAAPQGSRSTLFSIPELETLGGLPSRPRRQRTEFLMPATLMAPAASTVTWF